TGRNGAALEDGNGRVDADHPVRTGAPGTVARGDQSRQSSLGAEGGGRGSRRRVCRSRLGDRCAPRRGDGAVELRHGGGGGGGASGSGLRSRLPRDRSGSSRRPGLYRALRPDRSLLSGPLRVPLPLRPRRGRRGRDDRVGPEHRLRSLSQPLAETGPTDSYALLPGGRRPLPGGRRRRLRRCAPDARGGGARPGRRPPAPGQFPGHRPGRRPPPRAVSRARFPGSAPRGSGRLRLRRPKAGRQRTGRRPRNRSGTPGAGL
ncbi:hypothetical protein LTR94_026659, partial [Friedmanniomyces endolithicus]